MNYSFNLMVLHRFIQWRVLLSPSLLQILSVITDFSTLTHCYAPTSKGQSWMTDVLACLSVHLRQARRLTVHQQHLCSRPAPQPEPGVLRRGETISWSYSFTYSISLSFISHKIHWHFYRHDKFCLLNRTFNKKCNKLQKHSFIRLIEPEFDLKIK